jgi:hypothetical protein
MEKQCVSCEVQTDFLNITQMNFRLVIGFEFSDASQLHELKLKTGAHVSLEAGTDKLHLRTLIQK